jgi:cell wall-associated NlpC family hydrolase
MPEPYFNNDTAWSKFEEVIDSWMGTPYKHLQMLKGRGADCTLFIGACWLELGIFTKVEFDYYPRDWHIHTKEELVLDNLYRQFRDSCGNGYSFKRFPIDEPFIRGDMLAFATTKTGVTNHTSIWLGKKIMAHSLPQRGVSRFPFGGFFERKIKGVFRIMQW